MKVSSRNVLSAIALLVASSCATPVQQGGPEQPPQSTVSKIANEVGKTSGDNATNTPGGALATATAAVVSKVADRFMNPDDGRLQIRGICYLEDGAIETPLANAILILSNEAGDEVSRVKSGEDGRFSFTVRPGFKYQLRPFAKRFKAEITPSGPLLEGSQVVLKLSQE